MTSGPPPPGPPFSSEVQVILGTQYAGEMKKGVFSLMNYVLPKVGHGSCAKHGELLQLLQYRIAAWQLVSASADSP